VTRGERTGTLYNKRFHQSRRSSRFESEIALCRAISFAIGRTQHTHTRTHTHTHTHAHARARRVYQVRRELFWFNAARGISMPRGSAYVLHSDTVWHRVLLDIIGNTK